MILQVHIHCGDVVLISADQQKRFETGRVQGRLSGRARGRRSCRETGIFRRRGSAKAFDAFEIKAIDPAALLF